MSEPVKTLVENVLLLTQYDGEDMVVDFDSRSPILRNIINDTPMHMRYDMNIGGLFR